MIVNVFDERAPGKHEAASLEKGKNVVVVKITKEMTMEQVVSKIQEDVKAAGGGPGSISMLRFFGHGNAGTMDFGKGLQSWTVEPFKELASWMDPDGKGLELHGCYTGSAIYVLGQDCSKPGAFYPREHRPGVVGIGYDLLSELSFVLDAPVTAGVNCQHGDSAHKLEGPTITVSPDGYTLRNVPLDLYDDRGKSHKPTPVSSQPTSHVDIQDLQPSAVSDLSERIRILPDSDEFPHVDIQDHQPSAVSDLSERIRILPDSGELPHVDWHDRLTDFHGHEEHEEHEPFRPFADHNPMDRFGADQLRDFHGHEEHEEHEPFRPFADHNPMDRFGADQLKDFHGHEEHEEHEPFRPFADHNPMDRFGADQLKDFHGHEEHEPFRPFADHNPMDRFGADQLRDFHGHEEHEPFRPFADQPQWMKQGFSEPPHFSSLIDNQFQKPFSDKKWRK